MSGTLVLHAHPEIARTFFPEYRIQTSALSPPADVNWIICFPDWTQGVLPDIASARDLIADLKQHKHHGRITLISSALIYGASYRNPGLMDETRSTPPPRLSSIQRAWQEFEGLFQQAFPGRLGIVRCAPCPLIEPDSLFGALLERQCIPVLPPFDPPLQFLHPQDLAQALNAMRAVPAGEIFNIAPNEVLRPSLLARAKSWKPVRLNSIYRSDAVLKREVADCFRYPWSISIDKARAGLGFAPTRGSPEALGLPGSCIGKREPPDPFGMDPDYIEKHCKGIAGFLHEHYFRVEYEGEDKLPQGGNAILLGVHRGFMPFDALMLLVYFFTRRHSIIRVPSHPSLHKTPVPFNFAKLGGIPAFADNIDHVIRSGQWVLIFPEGITGAFKLYRDAYQLGSYGFKPALECAIRNQVPIVPVVTIGSAEIFPILKKLHWPWLQNKTLWPEFPLAPPFPLLPLPLPTKWKTVFLDPIQVEQMYSLADADNQEITGSLGTEIRGLMQTKLLELRNARKSWWW